MASKFYTLYINKLLPITCSINVFFSYFEMFLPSKLRIDFLDHALLQVTSPYGHDLHHTSNVTSGHFAFTTTESGSYLACFWLDGIHHSGKGAIVNLDWKVGIAARDWDSVAKKEKIEVIGLVVGAPWFHSPILSCCLCFLTRFLSAGRRTWSEEARRSCGSNPWEFVIP